MTKKTMKEYAQEASIKFITFRNKENVPVSEYLVAAFFFSQQIIWDLALNAVSSTTELPVKVVIEDYFEDMDHSFAAMLDDLKERLLNLDAKYFSDLFKYQQETNPQEGDVLLEELISVYKRFQHE